MINRGEPVVGDAVAGYQLEALLGEGGMGRVYRARSEHGEEVALKLVKAAPADADTFRRRFAREAQMASRVDHPHVVPVLDAGEAEGLPFLVASFIRGGSLEDRLRSELQLGLESTVRLALQIGAGIDALHRCGLIHRDIKPANILLGDEDCAYVADFGLAKDPDASMLTTPGHALGTIDYMAPEQIRGDEVTAATDVYALGCVVHECLSGSPPFADRKGMRVLWAHLQEEPQDLAACNEHVSEQLGWAVLRALDKEPARRPPTGTAYARMLQVAAGVPPLSPG